MSSRAIALRSSKGTERQIAISVSIASQPVGGIQRQGLDSLANKWGYRGTTYKATSGKCLFWALCLVEYPGCGTAPEKANARAIRT